MISYAVVGHFKRAKQASELAHALDASLSLDDGTYGSNENHARAWRSRPNKDGWVVVLEDDAIPVDNFKRSEEHTSELQSRENLVCRLLLEKKKNQHSMSNPP